MSIFKFKYDTVPVEVKEEIIETELSKELIEAFDSKVHCFNDKLNENRPGTATFANPRAALKAAAADDERPNRSVIIKHKDTGAILAKHPENKPGLRGLVKPLADAGHKVVMQSNDVDGEVIMESLDQLDDFLNEASKLSPTEGQYKAGTFPKGKVFKGSYGAQSALATTEPKQFTAPSIWGLTPKEPTGQAKAQARQVTFGDHSKDDTEELAGAQHGPAINHERFSVTMIPGKGFSVVDHLGVIVKGKDGSELTGYRKQGAAKIAMKDHERINENVVASFTFGELKEAWTGMQAAQRSYDAKSAPEDHPDEKNVCPECGEHSKNTYEEGCPHCGFGQEKKND